jgi:hypothetical protein
MLTHLSWSNHYEPSPKDWNQPQFYFPTYENDNLLCVLEEVRKYPDHKMIETRESEVFQNSGLWIQIDLIRIRI